MGDEHLFQTRTLSAQTKTVYSLIVTKHPSTALCWIKHYRFTVSHSIAGILVRLERIYPHFYKDVLLGRGTGWPQYMSLYHSFLSTEPVISLCVRQQLGHTANGDCSIVQQIHRVVITSVDRLNGQTNEELSATFRNPNFINRNSKQTNIVRVASL